MGRKKKFRVRQALSPRLGRVQREILTELSGGDLLVGFLLSGRSSRVMMRTAHKRAMRRYRDIQILEHLTECEYIRTQGERLYITEKGRSALGELVEMTRRTLDDHPWDGKWRIVIFDIPEIYATLRDRVRALLKRAGFEQLQQSAWIFPHECAEFVQFIREEPRLAKYVLYGVMERIEGTDVLKRKFKL